MPVNLQCRNVKILVILVRRTVSRYDDHFFFFFFFSIDLDERKEQISLN